MCGPAVAWDWLVLDVSYVVVLIGGSMVLRARSSSLLTWIGFGALSVAVGAFLLSATWLVGVGGTASAASADAPAALLSGC